MLDPLFSVMSCLRCKVELSSSSQYLEGVFVRPCCTAVNVEDIWKSEEREEGKQEGREARVEGRKGRRKEGGRRGKEEGREGRQRDGGREGEGRREEECARYKFLHSPHGSGYFVLQHLKQQIFCISISKSETKAE